MAITNAEKTALQSSVTALLKDVGILKTDVTGLKTDVAALKAKVFPVTPPPPPPPDTTADVGGDLKVSSLTQNAVDKRVTYTVSGLDGDATATVTFTDIAKKIITAVHVANGTYTIDLIGLANGSVTATIKATDKAVPPNTANGASASMILRGVVAQPPPGGSKAAQVLALLNATPLATVQGIGVIPTSYEAAFSFHADLHWNSNGAAYAGGGTNQGEQGGNYYDRAKMYYREWARTGNATYLTRANAHVVDFINNYLEPQGYAGSFIPQWMLPAGLACYDIANTSTIGKTAIGKLADTAHSNWMALVNTAPASQDPNSDADSRVVARILQILIWAKKTNAPTAVGANWDTDLAATLTGVLNRIDSDGAIRNYRGNYHNKAFMAGMVVESLVDYLEHVGADARIAPAIKKIVDYLWSDHWVPQRGALSYLDGFSVGETTDAASELNQFVAGAFWWVYSNTGDTTYRDKGDRIFIEGANLNDWSNGLRGGKQFNEQYTILPRYWTYRGTNAMANASLNRIIYPWDPTNPDEDLSFVTYSGAAPTSIGGGIWRLNLSGSGTYRAMTTQPWSNGLSGTATFHMRKAPTSGAAAAYIAVYDDASTYGVNPTKITLPADNSWISFGVTNAALSPAGTTGRIRIEVRDNSDATCAGNVDFDGQYLGVGATEVVEAAVPILVRDSEPTISGTAQVGQTLTATTGSWLHTPTSYARQWLRNGIPISGATNSTYVAQAADVGKFLSHRVIASNAAGASTPIKSSVTAAVIAA